MNDFKPGQVCRATVRGVPDVTVMHTDRTSDTAPTWSWLTAQFIGGARRHMAHDVTDVRPLVVLDLGEYDGDRAVTYLRNLARDSRYVNGNSPSPRGKLANLIADQIEEQTRPAIEEPKGLGAVVETKYGARWVRVDALNPWAYDSQRTTWDELTVVRILSPGVEP